MLPSALWPVHHGQLGPSPESRDPDPQKKGELHLVWGHAEGAVDTNHLTVHQWALNDELDEVGVFRGVAEATGERHARAQLVLHFLGQALQQRGQKEARGDRVDTDALLHKIACKRKLSHLVAMSKLEKVTHVRWARSSPQ